VTRVSRVSVGDRVWVSVTELLASSSGRCHEDVCRRIRVQAMRQAWSQSRLRLNTKLWLYQTSLLSIMLYSSETWMLLADETQTAVFPYELPAPTTRHQVALNANINIDDTTGRPSIQEIIDNWHQRCADMDTSADASESFLSIREWTRMQPCIQLQTRTCLTEFIIARTR